MIIENNFKGIKWETAKIKLRQYVSLLKLQNFDAANIKCFTVMLYLGPLGMYSVLSESNNKGQFYKGTIGKWLFYCHFLMISV